MKKQIILTVALGYLLLLTGISSSTLIIEASTELNQSLNNNIRITSSNVILNCNNHFLDGGGILGHGIYAVNLENITIRNCIVRNFTGHGISLVQTSNSRIISNTITLDKGGTGCGIIWQGDRNWILQNNIYRYPAALCNWWQADNNIIGGNILQENGEGILVHEASNNRIYENRIIHNRVGIHIRTINPTYSSEENQVYDNFIINNNLGTLIRGGRDNTIYHNNFLENKRQAQDSYPSKNHWNHLILLEGNFWSDNRETDDKYPYQEINGWFKKVDVKMNPETIGLTSKITAKIKMPDPNFTKTIDLSTVKLYHTPAIKQPKFDHAVAQDAYLTDVDQDGTAELVLKFDKDIFQKHLLDSEKIELTIQGKLEDGRPFHGADEIKASTLLKLVYRIHRIVDKYLRS